MKSYSVPLLDWREEVFHVVKTSLVPSIEDAWEEAHRIGCNQFDDDYICVDQLGTVES